MQEGNVGKKLRQAVLTAEMRALRMISKQLKSVFISLFSFLSPPLGTVRVGDAVCRKIIWGLFYTEALPT